MLHKPLIAVFSPLSLAVHLIRSYIIIFNIAKLYPALKFCTFLFKNRLNAWKLIQYVSTNATNLHYTEQKSRTRFHKSWTTGGTTLAANASTCHFLYSLLKCCTYTYTNVFCFLLSNFFNTVNVSLHRLIQNNSIARYVSNSGHVFLTLKILALI